MITQKHCKEIGGHCWKPLRQICRVCKHCGRKEDLTKLIKLKGYVK